MWIKLNFCFSFAGLKAGILKKNALLIFAKEPVPGQVKTRLTPFLSPDAAADLYRCMLEDTLEKAAALTDVEPIVFYDGDDDAAAFFKGTAAQMTVFPQKGADLGQRMKNAFATVFSDGFQKAVIIGTDSPHLPAGYITDAFHRLDDGQIEAVYGPSDDGGYYLLALKQLHGALFENITWSSGEVLAESLIAAGKAGVGTALLPPWYDLDTADDLMRPELFEEANGANRTKTFLMVSRVI